jgi:Ca2+-transporting ATPase
VVAATMLLTTLSVFHLFGALLSRDQLHTVFDRDTFPGVMQLRRYGLAVLAIVAITALDFLERIFDTTGLSFNQWCICIGIATSIIVVEEVIKFFLRRSASSATALPNHPVPVTPAIA